jgi:AraC family transcriptional activator of tynA and feaB
MLPKGSTAGSPEVDPERTLSPSALGVNLFATTIRTDALPVHRRLRFLRSSMRALSFDCRIEPAGDEPINTRMTAHVAEGFRLVKVAFTAHRTEYAAQTRTGRKSDTFLVSLHQQGEIIVSQDGRTTHIGPEQLFFIDTARPFSIDAGRMRCLSIYVSGARLRSVLPDLDRFTATSISARPSSGAMLGPMLEQISRNIAHIDDAGAQRIATSLPHLLGAALASQSGVANAPQTSEAGQVKQIRAFVLEHLTDPDLSCDTVSSGVALSVRRIHQLFEHEPATLMKWVWQERLKRSHADLTSVAMRNRSVGEIAFAWGFADTAHFSRAFKTAYGHSPRASRA